MVMEESLARWTLCRGSCHYTQVSSALAGQDRVSLVDSWALFENYLEWAL